MSLTSRQRPLIRVASGSVDRSDEQHLHEPSSKQRGHRRIPMTNLVKCFAHDESGATAIEYGLIAAGISVAIITVVNTLGSQLKSTFTNISSQLATAGK